MDTVMFGVNNGPNLYRPELGEGNVLVGGISPTIFSATSTASIASLYQSMNVPAIRPNDLGGPFDIRCMFPIPSVSDIPSENSTFEEIRDDPRWNWTMSDDEFSSLLEHGFAPYIKLASRDWISGIQEGLAYVGEDGVPQYVIPPTPLEEFCLPWPYISPIMESIGDKLVLTIVERYNNASKWSEQMAKGSNGLLKGLPPLESRTWAGITNTTVGVELQNEYNFLTCLPTGNGEKMTMQGWKNTCGGNPYTWSAKYWDGTPSSAHRSFVSQAVAIKARFPNVMIGGPAIGTSGSFGLQPDAQGRYPADGVALDWIRKFLKAVEKSSNETGIQILDWFSWHAYTSCQQKTTSEKGIETTVTDCSASNPTSMLGIAARMREVLDSEGFQNLPMVVSEHNANFAINGGNTFPGNIMGAAITAAHLIGFTLAKNEMKIHGAFIVNGVDGAFLPGNRNTFPLNCRPEFNINNTNNGVVGPSTLIFSGKYVNNCSYGDALTGAMSINSANGMGLLYSNGDKKPSAVLYRDFLSPFLSQTVQAPPVELPTSIAALYSEEGSCAKLLLVNADPFNSSIALPSIVSMMPTVDDAKTIIVSQMVQHLRGGPDIVLPNQILTLGTAQVQGRMIQSDLETSRLVLDQGAIQLPPAGIAMFDAGCQVANSSIATSGGSPLSGCILIAAVLQMIHVISTL